MRSPEHSVGLRHDHTLEEPNRFVRKYARACLPIAGCYFRTEEAVYELTDLGTRVVIKEACDELGAVLRILVVSSVHAAYLRHCITQLPRYSLRRLYSNHQTQVDLRPDLVVKRLFLGSFQ